MTMWFPVADEHDVVPRHVARASLQGHELVVWRADDGNVNVWENRCLHRGVRLSIGSNDGAELVCRYHAWRYANRSGGCTYIPAHPADAPARTAHCATFPVVERYGLIWTTLAGAEDPQPPVIDALEDDAFVLRARPVNAPAPVVNAALSARSGEIDEQLVVFVQPVDAGRSVIRPVRVGTPADAHNVLRHHAAWLGRLVEDLEAQPQQAIDPSTVETPVPLPVAAPPTERLTATIAAKWAAADGIAGFDLVAADGGVLPSAQPGDHIDVHLPGGLVRQYSLTNGPGETESYRLGVKRTLDSAGGSAYLHETAAVGDALEISAPRNHFSLRRNVPNTILIAGGIGITPIVAMAQALAHTGLSFTLHYFASTEGEFAFTDVLDRLGPAVHRHAGLGPDETGAVLESLLAEPSPDTQIAACGPPPMLDRIRSIAAAAEWPDDAVSFEYFDAGELDRSSTFTVELARSARTVDVGVGQSVLEAIRADGVDLSSSCERGACGTCAVTVIDGEVEHHDVYLSAAERAAGDTMLTCVSRAGSDRIVLDL